MTSQEIIARYFAADAKQDTDALLVLFTADAVVVDEDHTRRGTNEIRAWREFVASAYQYTTEILGVQSEGDGNFVARVRLEGTFPGSIVDLNHRFTIDGDRICRLEIAP